MNLAVTATVTGAVTTFLSHVRPNTSVNRDFHENMSMAFTVAATEDRGVEAGDTGITNVGDTTEE